MIGTITEPGVYDLPEDVYHADPVPGGSLSSTGARALLPPSTPARFRYLQSDRARTRAFDIGSAAHKLVLGTGPDIAIIDADDYKTKDAKGQRDAAYIDGAIPLLAHEHESVMAMVMQVRRHSVAGPLFAGGTGQAEQSLFWVDKATGVWCRARLDWIKPATTGGRVIIADLKTTIAADDESISKTIARYGYHQQAAFYLEGVKQLGIHPDPAFILVFVEKTPPHLVHVVQLDSVALQIAHAKNARALETYKTCTELNEWPGYAGDITILSLPAWAEKTEIEEYLNA